jgi:hypothetical protein
LGYKDGSRFINLEEEVNPQMEEMQAQLEELQNMIATDQAKNQGRMQIEELKNQGDMSIAQLKSQTDIQKEMIRQQTDIKEAQIKREDAVTKRGELLLQKAALQNQSREKDIDRQLELDAQGGAGTIRRDRYNKIPFARG